MTIQKLSKITLLCLCLSVLCYSKPTQAQVCFLANPITQEAMQKAKNPTQNCAQCDQVIGGNGFAENWNDVFISARTFGSSDFTTDNVFFSGNSPATGGVGVKGLDRNDGRFKQINYIPSMGTEALRFTFCRRSEGFTSAEVLLSHLYKEYGKIEQGYWVALSNRGVEIARGDFAAVQFLGNGNPGELTFTIETTEPFYALEFYAGPYGNQRTNYQDASDYYVRKITPTCKKATCEDVLGGANQDWSLVDVYTKGIDDANFSIASPNAYEADWAGVAGSGGVGVPGPYEEDKDRSRFHEINYIGEKRATELVRVDLGDVFTQAKVTVSRFYGKERKNKAEQGYWIAYRKVGNSLTEVGRGEFIGEQPWCRTCAGQKEFYIETASPFNIIEFGAGPYLDASRKGAPEDNSDYLLHSIEPCVAEPNPCNACIDECSVPVEVVEFNQGLTKGGYAVPASRSDVTKVLGDPQRSDNHTSNNNHNFLSLGMGGSIVLKMSCSIEDREGYDFELIETSFNSPSFSQYPEQAEVFVSNDGINWVSLGLTQPDVTRPLNANNTDDKLGARFDLAGSGVGCASYIKIVDKTDPSRFNNAGDGFDIDGISCVGGDVVGNTPERNTVQTLDTYPNPFVSRVTMNFSPDPEIDIIDNIKVEITTTTGRVVFSKNYAVDGDNKEVEMDLQHLDKGIYIVKTTSSAGVFISRIIK